MSDHDRIDAGSRRIIQAWPEVFGTGPWPLDRSLLAFGFECGPGWHPLIDRLCRDLAAIIREDGLTGFEVRQVKEKFGELRFYCSGGNDRIWARIDQAEAESAITCEACGTRPSPIRCRGGWYSTCCDPCHERMLRERG